jgi:8-oxo-dGTP pyrophosphatase MutT (NUDIX family)
MAVVLQAGAVAVRMRNGAAQVLVVRAKKNPADWIFPKGHIEAGEAAPEAAVRELLEEGGVVGEAADLLGVSRFRAGDRQLKVSYYLVWYQTDGIAHERREKQWLPLDEARKRVSFDDARGYLDKVAALVRKAR